MVFLKHHAFCAFFTAREPPFPKQALGKRLDAERLVRRRLEEAPDDPLLWLFIF